MSNLASEKVTATPNPNTLRKILQQIPQQPARRQAELILAKVTHTSLTQIYTHPETSLTPAQFQKFQKIFQAQQRGQPLAQIFGEQEFFGLNLHLSPDVLIPRPETEILVTKIIQANPQSLLEIGTGSGCIALAVKKNCPHCQILATDIAPSALKIARQNARRLKLSVTFQQSDLLAQIPATNKFSLVAANLPYISLGSPALSPTVRKFENPLALFGGRDGLTLIKRLLTEIAQRPNFCQKILLEIGFDQKAPLTAYLKKIWPKAKINFTQDLAQIPRVCEIILKTK